MSILFLYWRIFRMTNNRLPIQILSGCCLIWLTFRIFMGIWHCVPVERFWDSTIEGYCAIEEKKFFFSTTLVHAVIDIAILVLPMWQIEQLQLPVVQKAGIIIMVTFEFFICAAAIRVLVAARVYNDQSPDITWGICDIIIWTTVEVSLINVSASLPIIRPACSYPGGYGLNEARQSIRLDTANKPKLHDEPSSTHQLAGSDDGRGRGSMKDFESHAVDGEEFQLADGQYTATATRGYGASREDFGPNFRGILVKNEVVLRTSKE
ncbi:hypothetical protein LZL87_014371 [Fusarium oxysporum]|nr:hypothetical protein LZL87_014371 [Fusarium oxysporum]